MDEQGARASQAEGQTPQTFVSKTYGRSAADPMPTREMPAARDRSVSEGAAQPVAPRGTAVQRARRTPRARIIIRGLVILLVAWLVYLVAVAVVTYFRIDSVDAKPDGQRPADGPGRNYLLVGSDSREDLTPEQQAELGTGDTAGRRTDTILLMHVPDGGGETVLVSIPRDSLVEIPGQGSSKINAAYALGGAELLTETVESSTGVRIDDYVEIGFAGFAELVDATGGVEVCPEGPMVDPMANLDIPAGCQTLNGPTALGYVRSRATPLGDLERVERQREVIGKIADQAVSPATVVNPVRYRRTMFAGSDAVTVGEQTGPLDLARFALGMRRVTGPDGRTLTVPVADTPTIDGLGSVVRWDEVAARALFETIQNDQPVPKS